MSYLSGFSILQLDTLKTLRDQCSDDFVPLYLDHKTEMVKVDFLFTNKVLQALDDTNCPWIACKKFGHLCYVIMTKTQDILKLYAVLLNIISLILVLNS